MQGRIIVLGLSPGLQRTISFERFESGKINRSHAQRIDASGKACNCARVLIQLEEHSALLLCPLGRDNASFFNTLLEKDGLQVISVEIPGSTRCCYTILDDRALLENETGSTGVPRMTELVVDEEPASTAAVEAAAESLLSRLVRELQPLNRESPAAAALVIAGSRPAPWPQDFYTSCVLAAKEAGVPVLVDYRGAELRRTLERIVPDIIKINESEFYETFLPEGPLETKESEELLLERICCESRRLGTSLVVTRGREAILAAAAGLPFRKAVEPLVPVNEIGCGDAFSAGFIYSWTRGASLTACLEKGDECARLNALSIRPGSIS